MRLSLLWMLAAPLSAQFPLHLDLSGDWRHYTGDDPAFARADFDDRSWKPYRLPRLDTPSVGNHWLRRTIEIPVGTDTGKLALTIGPVMDVYEVFVNGQRVGARGERLTSKILVARPHTFDIPPGLVLAGESAVIALRCWRPLYQGPNYRNFWGLPDEGPYLLTYRGNVPPDVAASSMRKRERLAANNLVIAVFNGVILLVLFLAWLMERGRLDLAYLMLFILAGGTLRLVNYLSLVLDWSHMTPVITGPLLTVPGVFLALLAFEVTGVRPPRWVYWAIWIPTLLHTSNNIEVWRKDIDYSDFPGLTLWLSSLTTLLDVMTLAVLIFAVWRAWRNRTLARDTFVLSISLAMVVVQRIPGFVESGDSVIGQLLRHTWIRQGFTWTTTDLASIALNLAMTTILLHRLGADRREKERLASELEAARTVQQLLLTPPTATEEYQASAVYEPAHQVGGDFYWTRVEADRALTVVVGDVSGKGLRAAMLASMATGVLRQAPDLRPAALLAALNRALAGQTGGGFVTCCCARFEANGVLTVANAGHLPPYIDGSEVDVEAGLPLGILSDDARHTEVQLNLARGATLTLVSDGVLEASSASGELFGFERTRQISKRSAAEIAEAAKAWGQNDDITVVTVQRRKAG